MNPASSLFVSLPLPTAGNQDLAPTINQSAPAPSDAKSFFSVMTQAEADVSSAPAPSAAVIPDSTNGPTGASATLTAALAQSQSTSGHSRKSETHAYATKEAVRPSTGQNKSGLAPITKLKTALPQEPLVIPTLRKVMTEENVDFKTVPDAKGARDRRAAKKADTDSSKAEPSKITPDPQPSAVELVTLAVSRTIELPIAPVGLEGMPSPSKKAPTGLPAKVDPSAAVTTTVAGQQNGSPSQTVIYKLAQAGEGQNSTYSASSSQDVNTPVANAKSSPNDAVPDANAAAQAVAPTGPETRSVRTAAHGLAEKLALTERAATLPTQASGSIAKPVTAPSKVQASGGEGDGTRGALNSPRMTFSVKKNEIAGATAQKVPVDSEKDGLSAAAASMDWPTKAGASILDSGKAMAANAAVDNSALQAERLGKMVSQQVVMVRQSGANILAVSLKLDSQNEINLQLTNHNGQIEAAVRWERGSVAGLENHWKDLQDSLARQNVQLLPLETKPVARTTAYGSPPDSGTASFFKQSSQHPPGQSREALPEALLPSGVTTISGTGKATTGAVSRQGWESWA